MPQIKDNLTKVAARLQAACEAKGRSRSEITLLAVSKTQAADAIREAWSAGQECFGENYLQEALDKQTQLTDLSIQWHFIGPIQSNKTRAIAENFDWVHSVDRVKIARRLSEQRKPSLPALNICLQINLDEEDSKAGISLEELPETATAIAALPNLCLRGLMAIPARQEDYQMQVASLQRLSDAFAALRPQYPSMDTLSMGMSADLEAAVEAGSTLVRVGTDIFGQRKQRESKA